MAVSQSQSISFAFGKNNKYTVVENVQAVTTLATEAATL